MKENENFTDDPKMQEESMEEEENSGENTDLSSVEQDVLSFSFLKKNGLDVSVPFSRKIFLMHTYIAGTSHVEDLLEIVDALQSGEALDLVLEPENLYDPHAILVRTKWGQKLGYIPRKKNEVLFHLMDAGKNLYGVIEGIGESNTNWIEIWIDVFMED